MTIAYIVWPTSGQEFPMAPEEELLVLSARHELDAEDKARMIQILGNPLDWERVLDLSERLGLQPLLHHHLSRKAYTDTIPDSVMHRLADAYRRQSIKNLRIYGQLSRIMEATDLAGISIVPLKGIFLAKSVYRDMGLRPMTDMDLLCREEDVQKVQRIFINLGYDQISKADQSPFHGELAGKIAHHLPPFQHPRGIPVELHTNIFSKNLFGARDVEQLWASAVPYESGGVHSLRLSLEHQFLHLILHLHKHILSGGVTLYWFCDLHEFVTRFGTQINWVQVKAMGESLKATRKMANVSDLLIQYWKTPFPKTVDFPAEKPVQSLNLKSILFGKGMGSYNFLPDRIKLVHRVKEESGWKKSVYYTLRHFIPVKAHIVERYHPTNRSELFHFYIMHFSTRFKNAFSSLMAHIRSAR